MNKLKENYQFVIGFVAIVISLSAFKDELKEIKINLSFFSFDASDLFFWLIIGYLIILQIYTVPFIFSRKFPDSKFLIFIGDLAYITFVFLTLTPLIIGVIYLFDWLINLIPPISFNFRKNTSILFSVVMGSLSSKLANNIVKWFKNERTNELVDKLEEEEVKELEEANKLALDGYYAQSILELSKTITTRLNKILISQGITLKKRNFLELIKVSKKNNLLSDEDIVNIEELRVLRNKVVHESDIIVSQKESYRLLLMVQTFLKKTK